MNTKILVIAAIATSILGLGRLLSVVSAAPQNLPPDGNPTLRIQGPNGERGDSGTDANTQIRVNYYRVASYNPIATYNRRKTFIADQGSGLTVTLPECGQNMQGCLLSLADVHTVNGVEFPIFTEELLLGLGNIFVNSEGKIVRSWAFHSHNSSAFQGLTGINGDDTEEILIVHNACSLKDFDAGTETTDDPNTFVLRASDQSESSKCVLLVNYYSSTP